MIEGIIQICAQTFIWQCQKTVVRLFTNEKISDSPFTPDKSVFFGDYTNISAHGGVVRPIWTRCDGTELSIWTALINK